MYIVLRNLLLHQKSNNFTDLTFTLYSLLETLQSVYRNSKRDDLIRFSYVRLSAYSFSVFEISLKILLICRNRR